VEDTDQVTWTGRGKGSTAGNRFFMILIRFFGTLPAYLFLIPVTFFYALKDRQAAAALKEVRCRAGASNGFWSIYRNFLMFGTSLVDRFAFLLNRQSFFTYSCINETMIAEKAREKRGIILLGSHVGNWELAGNLLVDRIGVPINIVILDAEKESLKNVYKEALKNRRMNLIPLSDEGTDTMIAIINALKRGEIVSLMGDRSLQQKSRECTFLGKIAAFPAGPFIISALTGALIIPIFAFKTGLRHYTFQAFSPISITADRTHRDEEIDRAMKEYIAVLESQVQKHPSQWYNFYPFWQNGTVDKDKKGGQKTPDGSETA